MCVWEGAKIILSCGGRPSSATLPGPRALCEVGLAAWFFFAVRFSSGYRALGSGCVALARIVLLAKKIFTRRATALAHASRTQSAVAHFCCLAVPAALASWHGDPVNSHGPFVPACCGAKHGGVEVFQGRLPGSEIVATLEPANSVRAVRLWRAKRPLFKIGFV